MSVHRSLSLIVLLALPAAAWAGATVTVVNLDGGGEGFNDPTPVGPVGGNDGTTRGQQRLIAFQFAADTFGSILNSAVEIRVGGGFASLACGGGGAILGSAGPKSVFRDFGGAPLAGTWYAGALADSLAGSDLDPGDEDIDATFNSRIDDGCLGGISGWYYGLDGQPPGGQLDFVNVLLHEIAHGLGFLTFVSSGGAKLAGFDDAYMRHLEDHSTGVLYPAMTNAERAAANVDTGDLHFTGPSVVAMSGILSAGRDPVSGHVEIYAPAPYQGGSSVSHFSTSLSPNELMEPSLTSFPIIDLTIALLDDTGWTVCGDGVVDLLEGCDDGGRAGGDGCSAGCVVEPCHTCADSPSVCSPEPDGSGCDDGTSCTIDDECTAGACVGTPDDGAPCDDGTACTEPDVCSSGVCVGAAPLAGPCIPVDLPAKSFLKLIDRSPDSKDKLVWKWAKGTSVGLFGDPTSTTTYSLCVVDAADGLLMSSTVAPGGTWVALGVGFRFADKTLASDGISKVILKDGEFSTAKVIAKGKGSGLGMTDLSALDLPVTVQLTNGTTCWEAVYDTNVQRHDAKQFKAKSE